MSVDTSLARTRRRSTVCGSNSDLLYPQKCISELATTHRNLEVALTKGLSFDSLRTT